MPLGGLLALLQLGGGIGISIAIRLLGAVVEASVLARQGPQYVIAAGYGAMWIAVITTPLFASALVLNTLCSEAVGAGLAGGPGATTAGQWLQLALVCSTMLAIAAIIMVYTTTEPMLALFASAQQLSLAVQYARMASLAILPQVWFACLRQYCQSLGVVRPAVVLSIIMVFIHAALNWVFTFKLGAEFLGPAMAVVTAATVELALYALYVVYFRRSHQAGWGGWTRKSFTIVRLGIYARRSLTTAVAQAMDAWSIMLLAVVAAQAGSTAAAVYTIQSRVWRVMWAVSAGLGVALQIHVARAVGSVVASKKCDDRSTEALPSPASVAGKGVCATVAVSVALSAVVVTLRSVLGDALLGGGDTVATKLMGDTLPSAALAVVAYSAALALASVAEGLSCQQDVAYSVAVAQWLVMLPIATCAVWYGGGVRGIWLSAAAAAIVKCIILGRALSRRLRLCRSSWGSIMCGAHFATATKLILVALCAYATITYEYHHMQVGEWQSQSDFSAAVATLNDTCFQGKYGAVWYQKHEADNVNRGASMYSCVMRNPDTPILRAVERKFGFAPQVCFYVMTRKLEWRQFGSHQDDAVIVNIKGNYSFCSYPFYQVMARHRDAIADVREDPRGHAYWFLRDARDRVYPTATTKCAHIGPGYFVRHNARSFHHVEGMREEWNHRVFCEAHHTLPSRLALLGREFLAPARDYVVAQLDLLFHDYGAPTTLNMKYSAQEPPR